MTIYLILVYAVTSFSIPEQLTNSVCMMKEVSSEVKVKVS